MTEKPEDQEEQKEDEVEVFDIDKYETSIIEIGNGNSKHKVPVKSVPIKFEGKDSIVQVKRLGYGEKAAYEDKIIDIQVMGTSSKTKISMQRAQEQAVLMGVHKAPFPITENYVRYELDPEIGEEIYKVFSAFNSISQKKKQK